MMKLRALLHHTRGGPLLLGAPEGSDDPSAPEPAAASEEDPAELGQNGDCPPQDDAPVEVETEEPTAEAPQAELVVVSKSEEAPLAAKDAQPDKEMEPGSGAAAPSEPATPARAPAFAPLSPREERTELAEAPSAEESLTEAADQADEPLSQVACEGVPLEDSIMLGVTADDSAAEDPAAPVVPTEAAEVPLPAAGLEAAVEAEEADVPAPEGELAPAAAPAPAEAPPTVEEVTADSQPASLSEEAQPAVADEGAALAASEAFAGEEPDLVFVVSENSEAKLIEGAEGAAAAEDALLSSLPAAPTEEQPAAKLVAAEHSAPGLKSAASSASSEAELVPAPRTPAASIVGGMRVASPSPKKKKRNPVHKVQKMLGLKSSGSSGSKSHR
jgi:ribonuclease E